MGESVMRAARGGVRRPVVRAMAGVVVAAVASVSSGCTASPADGPTVEESVSSAAVPGAPELGPSSGSSSAPAGSTAAPTGSVRPTPSTTTTAAKPTPQRAVRLLHEGAPPEPGIEENTPWTPAAVKVTVCWQDVPLTGAREQRAVSALVDMERWSEGLVVFGTADQAVRFMQVARISVSECSAGDGSPWQGRMQELRGVWGDGVAISYGSSTSPSSTGPPLGETTLVLARVGRAVTYAVRGSHGILGPTVSAQGVAELRPALDHVAPQLCRYTRAGC